VVVVVGVTLGRPAVETGASCGLGKEEHGLCGNLIMVVMVV
jgi:hypothetical protein